MNGINEDIIKKAAEKTGISGKDISSAIKTNNIDGLLGNLSEDDANTVKKFLNDKEATKKLLNSPEAKAILNSLFKK